MRESRALQKTHMRKSKKEQISEETPEKGERGAEKVGAGAREGQAGARRCQARRDLSDLESGSSPEPEPTGKRVCTG